MSTEKTSNLTSFTWSIAEVLREDFKQPEYGILPILESVERLSTRKGRHEL
jgi:hypothetical protein